MPVTLHMPTDRRAHFGRGGVARPVFWWAAAGLAGAIVAGLPLDGASATLIGTLVFIGGGMPHGAYDIALLTRTARFDRASLGLAIFGYVAVAIFMGILWIAAPLIALIIFLGAAAVHFGADWTMLEERLLRVAAGTAIIAAPAISHPTEVTRLFVAMAGSDAGDTVARVASAVAPVALLVTAVGMLLAWRDGAREWAMATAVAILALLVAPPVAGFALFFVFLHAPQHLIDARAALGDLSRRRWLAIGAGVSATAIGAWLAFAAMLGPLLTSNLTAQSFQLLATVAVPHLLFSRWIERRLAQAEPSSESRTR